MILSHYDFVYYDLVVLLSEVCLHLLFNCPPHGLFLVKISDFYQKMTFHQFPTPISQIFYIPDIWTVCYNLFFDCPHHGPSLKEISDLYPKMMYFIIFYTLGSNVINPRNCPYPQKSQMH